MNVAAHTHEPRLSPLNFNGLIAGERERRAAIGNAQKPRKRALSVYLCPECNEHYDFASDAEDCCASEPGDAKASCPVCGDTDVRDQRDASDCCLWKDFDSATRWRMADAVEAGSTWAEQLGVTA